MVSTPNASMMRRLSFDDFFLIKQLSPARRTKLNPLIVLLDVDPRLTNLESLETRD